MDIKRVVQKLLNKPPLLVVVPIVYFFLIMFAKWQLQLPLEALFFFIGGLVGVYILDVAEEIFEVNPSPFRTTLFVICLGVVGFYMISSTREMIASGLVLGLMMTIFLFQVSEWRIRKNLDSWYGMFMGNVSQTTQKIGIVLLGFVLLWETVMFITG